MSSQAVVRRCSLKKLFLEISQNSQENTCARVSFLIKLHGLACNLFIKKETLAQVLSVNFVKFLRTPFLQNTSGGCSVSYTIHSARSLYMLMSTSEPCHSVLKK